MRCVVVGAGIIGCAIAYALAKCGVRVTVLDAAAAPGAGASGASFGWINASFYLDPGHFRLRQAGITAWAALADEVDVPGLCWTGALWWEEQGAALRRMQSALTDMNHAVDCIDAEQVSRLEPHVIDAPEAALRFAEEGCVDPQAACVALAASAQRQGARFVFGGAVERVVPGRVESAAGVFEADQIILATGTGTEAMLQPLGVHVPLLSRPGVLMKTTPVPPRLSHVLVTPEGEIRQDAQGRIVMPTAVAHQADTADSLPTRPDHAADAAMARLRAVVDVPPDTQWAEISAAARPVPQDGLPVLGAVADGLYVAVMHSGVTLAAFVGETVARELQGARVNMLGPYRPDRFKTAV